RRRQPRPGVRPRRRGVNGNSRERASDLPPGAHGDAATSGPAAAGPGAVAARDASDLACPPMPIRVVLAEDHALLRQGLERLLTAAPDVELVGVAEDLPTVAAL